MNSIPIIVGFTFDRKQIENLFMLMEADCGLSNEELPKYCNFLMLVQNDSLYRVEEISVASNLFQKVHFVAIWQGHSVTCIKNWHLLYNQLKPLH